MFPLDVCKRCSRFWAFTTSFQATRPYRVHASNKAAPTVSHDRLIFGVTHLLPNTVVLHFKMFIFMFVLFFFLLNFVSVLMLCLQFFVFRHTFRFVRVCTLCF